MEICKTRGTTTHGGSRKGVFLIALGLPMLSDEDGFLGMQIFEPRRIEALHLLGRSCPLRVTFLLPSTCSSQQEVREILLWWFPPTPFFWCNLKLWIRSIRQGLIASTALLISRGAQQVSYKTNGLDTLVRPKLGKHIIFIFLCVLVWFCVFGVGWFINEHAREMWG